MKQKENEKKVCILLIHNSKDSGLYNYAQIFHQSYPNSEIVLLSDLYPNESQWLVYFKFSRFRKRIESKVIEIKEKFDLVHICDNPIYMLKVMNICDEQKLNTILTLHDPHSHDEKSLKGNLKKFLKLFIQNSSLKKTQRLEYVKVHVHGELVSKKFKRQVVLPHPTYHTHKFSLNTSDQFVVGFFGRIEYYKGIDLFLEILHQLDSQVSKNELKTVIVGKGELPPYNAMKNIEMDIYNYFIDDRDFDRLLASCDVVILPYREASQSGILMKTMSYNTPVLVSNIPELTNHVVQNKTGYILNLNEIKEWCDKLLWLKKNKDDLKIMREAIKSWKEKYDPIMISNQLYS